MVNLYPKKRIKLNDLIVIFGNGLCSASITKFIFYLNKMTVVCDYYEIDSLATLLQKYFI